MISLKPYQDPHEITTASAGSAYPFTAQGSLGPRGVYIGQDLYGAGAFCYDPWEFYPHIITSPNKIVMGQLGAGKALDVDTPIPTPTGWTTMGRLEVGDQVFDERGHPTLVIATSDVMRDRSCYEVVFSDGSTIVADAEHQWVTMTRREREWLCRRRTGRVAVAAGVGEEASWSADDLPQPRHPVTTEQIAATLKVGGQANHAIPIARPLQIPVAELSVHPYVLGVWLGDGHNARPELTTADQDILALLESYGVHAHPQRAKYQYTLVAAGSERVRMSWVSCGKCGRRFEQRHRGQRFCGKSCAASRPRVARGTGEPQPPCETCGKPLNNGGISSRCRTCWQASSLRWQLGQVGVLGHKHIPSSYLRASEGQRRQLLAGLLDTDGSATQSGRVELTLTNGRLANGAVELIRSLGYRPAVCEGRARLRDKDCGPKWIISFATRDQVFRLPRKVATHAKTNRRSEVEQSRYAIAVRPVPSRPVRCIRVTAASHLYLAGSAMVPTHNSGYAKTYLSRQLAFGRRGLIIDIKNQGGQGEYTRLCQAAGQKSLKLEPGGKLRLNPLDTRVAGSGLRAETLRVDQVNVLYHIAHAALRRELEPLQRLALRLALNHSIEAAARVNLQPTLNRVADAMLHPQGDAWERYSLTRADLLVAGRDVAVELTRLCEDGELAGMFDGQTSEDIDFAAPLVHLDISSMQDSDALGILMICSQSRLQRLFFAEAASTRRVMVVDECWNVLRELPIARFMQYSTKLAGSLGIQVIFMIHKLSDLASVGSAGDEQVQLAKGMLGDTQTQVLFLQNDDSVRAAKELLQLNDAEADMIPNLQPHVALFRVNRRSFVVGHRLLSPTEEWIVNTNERRGA